MGDIGGIAQAAGTVAAAGIQSNAISNAANLQYQAATNAQNIQSSEFNTQQQNIAPWLSSGDTALGQLNTGTAPGGSLVTPYPGGQFSAPTEAQAEQTQIGRAHV